VFTQPGCRRCGQTPDSRKIQGNSGRKDRPNVRLIDGRKHRVGRRTGWVFSHHLAHGLVAAPTNAVLVECGSDMGKWVLTDPPARQLRNLPPRTEATPFLPQI
jgi:hypothetical protein